MVKLLRRNDDATGWTSTATGAHAPDMDPANFTKVLLKKIRASFKEVFLSLKRKDTRDDETVAPVRRQDATFATCPPPNLAKTKAPSSCTA